MPREARFCVDLLDPSTSLARLRCPVLCAAPQSTPPPPPTRTGLSRRALQIVVPAPVAGYVVVGVLLFASPSGFVAPSCIIEQASLLLPLSSFVLPFGTPGAPARPRLVWSSVRGKRGSHFYGVWFLLLYAWKPTSNTQSPSLPQQYACTAVLLPCFCRLPPPSPTTTKRDHATTRTTKQATPSLFCPLAVNVKRCFSSLPFPYTNYSLPRHVA